MNVAKTAFLVMAMLTGILAAPAAHANSHARAGNVGPVHRSIPPKAFSAEMIQVFIEGGTVNILRCDELQKCLNPTFQPTTIPANQAFYARVKLLVQGLSDAIRNDTTPPPGASALVGMTSTPVYKTLIVASSYKHQFVDDEITQISELVAIEFTMRYIAEALEEMQTAAANTDAYGDMIGQYQDIVQRTLSNFGEYRQEAADRYAGALNTLRKLALTQTALSAKTASNFAAAIKK